MGSVNFGQLKFAYLLFDCVLSLILYISISYKEKKNVCLNIIICHLISKLY